MKEDLELIQETMILSQAHIDEKAKLGTPEYDPEAAEAASRALDAHRVKWRGIREWMQAVAEQEWADEQAAIEQEG